MGRLQVRPLQVRVDLEVMAIKGQSILHKAPEQELSSVKYTDCSSADG